MTNNNNARYTLFVMTTKGPSAIPTDDPQAVVAKLITAGEYVKVINILDERTGRNVSFACQPVRA